VILERQVAARPGRSPPIHITTVADLYVCPDVDVFVQGMRDALGFLASARIDNRA
jgi:hypothetical protein